MPITRNFTLYLNAGISVAPTVHVNQYDRGEQWVFTLLDDKGQKYTPSSGALIGVKADGNAIAGVTGTVGSNGDVYITETQQMTAAAGKAIFELTIDGMTHGTANFIVQVEKKPTEDAVLSESDLSIIQQGIDSVTPAAINETVSEYLAEHMTNPPIDPTLTVSNAAADAKVTGDKVTELKSALNTVAEEIYEGVESLPVSLKSGFIGGDGNIQNPSANNEDYTNKISVSEGDELTVDLQLVTSTKTIWLACAQYSADESFIKRVNIDTTSVGSVNTTIKIPSGVSFVAFTFRTYDGASFKVTKHWEWMDNIKNDIERKLDDPYFVYTDGFVVGSISGQASPDTKRAKTKPILGRGILTVKNAQSEGYRIVLRTWSDAPYGTLDYDSGWITTNNYSYDVKGKYYAVGVYLLPIGDEVIDLTALNNSNIEITEMSDDKTNIVVNLADEIADISEKIGYVNLPSVTVKSIAHRGDDIDAPQCTEPAYIMARKRGFTIAENDVWYSQDGEYVMWHDINLARLGNLVDINGYLMYTDGSNYYWVNSDTNAVYTWNGSDYVESSVSLDSLTRCAGANYGVNSEYNVIGLPLNILKRIDFGVYKGEKFKGTQILTFEEWVLLCKQLGMEIYIDRKWNYTNEQVADLANIVKKYGMGDKASWLGMDGAKLIALRNIIPDSRCCLLQHPSASLIEAYTPYNTGRGFFFNGNAKDGMTAETIQLGLNAGFEVEVWFVDYGALTEEQLLETIRTAVSCGVTGITLDHYRVEDAFKYLLEQY